MRKHTKKYENMIEYSQGRGRKNMRGTGSRGTLGEERYTETDRTREREADRETRDFGRGYSERRERKGGVRGREKQSYIHTANLRSG